MKRLFIAIGIRPDRVFLSLLGEFRSLLIREQIKWVGLKNIHITVKFLGETEEERIPGIIMLLNKLAGSTPDFSFCLSGLGIFGSSYNPRVIWAGISPFEELAALMNMARKEFETLGYEADRQNLVPHLTLGRIRSLKNPRGFHAALERYREISSGPMEAGDLILFESKLRQSGPEYHTLAAVPLKKNLPG